MTTVWGVLLGAGVVLIMSPWLWPEGRRDSDETAPPQLTRLLEEAGLPRVTVSTVSLVCALLAVCAAAFVWLLTEVTVVAMLAAVTGLIAPIAWLRARRSRLIASRRAIWSDVCDLLIASVRAGMSLPDAVGSLAETTPATLRPAFDGFRRDIAASGHFDSAASRLKGALADPVADRIIETLRMARQVGGTELVGVLLALAASVRADATLRAEVEARQSWVRGAAVLGVAAPWVILLLLATRPEGARAYGSPEGFVLIVAGAVVSLVAYRVMIAIGRLPEPRRWFA